MFRKTCKYSFYLKYIFLEVASSIQFDEKYFNYERYTLNPTMIVFKNNRDEQTGI